MRKLGRIAAALGLLIAVDAQAAAPQRPNLVVILADDLGWGDVGFQGGEIPTPNLDRLAAEGLRFERFYVQPLCSPTRAALLTGREPHRYGLQNAVFRPWVAEGLPVEETLASELLQRVGYATALIGKWHLGAHARVQLPLQRGFDHHYGHYLGAIDHFSHRTLGGLDWHRDGAALREAGYAGELLAAQAERWIAARDASQPFFLLFAPGLPHAPLQAPEDALARFASISDPQRRAYAAMLSVLDTAAGRIAAALDAGGLAHDTLLVFASDNGADERVGGDNGTLRGGKATPYEGGVRVPAFAHWPGRIAAGRVSEALVHVTDLLPTFLALAGAETPRERPLDGFDLVPLLDADAATPREEILHLLSPELAALQRGGWKIVVRNWNNGKRRRIELYELASDPGESRNRAAEQPQRVAELLRRLEAHAAQARPALDLRQPKPARFRAPAVWGDSAD